MPNPNANTDRRSGRSGKRTALWIFGGLCALVLGGIGLGALVGGSLIRSKLEAIAKDAGMTLKLENVSLSPFGVVRMTGLEFKRADGSTVIAVQDATAELSPWKALSGRRRPQRADVHVFSADLLLQDGKPKEMLDLYKAARKQFPKRDKIDDSEDKQPKTSTALFVEQGAVTIRATGKGSQYLPQGLRAHDIALHVDLSHGIGDLSATVDGTVASKLQASLETQPDGPPRLAAKFAPEFRLKMPATAPLPLGVDSVSVAGIRFDAQAGGSLEDLVLRAGEQVVVAVKHIRPLTARLGAQAEQIAFALPDQLGESADDEAKPAPKPDAKKDKDAKDAGKPPAPKAEPPAKAGPPKVWNGTAERLSLGLDGVEGGEIPVVAKLDGLKVTVPGNAAVVSVDSVELHTDRIPGEHALEALTLLTIDHPTVDLPWRAEALQHFPGGAQLWKAVSAAELAKLKREIEDEAEEELTDAELRPDQKADLVAKKVDEKLRAAGKLPVGGKPGDPKVAAKAGAGKPGEVDAEGRKVVAPARKAWTTKQIAPLRELFAKAMGSSDLVEKVIGKMARAPHLKFELKSGRMGLVKDGTTKPFGGVQDLTVSSTPVQGDGTRGLLLSARPFDEERVWGDLQADVLTGPGPKLDRAKISLKGGHFAQALRIVSSAVTVAPDSDVTAALELKPGPTGSQVLTATGEFSIKKVGFDWWRLAPKSIDVGSASGKLVATLSGVDNALKLEFPDLVIGEAHLHVLLEATDIASKPTVHVLAEMPKQDCAKVAAAVPPGMLSTIGSIEASGEIAWSLDMKVPLSDPYGSKLELSLDDTTCQISKFANIDLAELAGDFSWPVNENGTKLEDVPVGPKSGFWVPFAEIPKWTWWAMVATEDGNFYKHRGIAPGLVLRAIKLDLDHGRFVYGGSSITQQLVKNIYLTREKTLSRKFEELLIVWHIERNLAAFLPPADAKEPPNKRAKDRILELYTNMIEFGGDGKETKVYGIQRGAQAYFGKDARALGPTESAFLAVIKPFPKHGWMIFQRKYWEKPGGKPNALAARVPAVVEKMLKEGYITKEQYVADHPYVPKFLGWEQAIKPADVPSGGTEE